MTGPSSPPAHAIASAQDAPEVTSAPRDTLASAGRCRRYGRSPRLPSTGPLPPPGHDRVSHREHPLRLGTHRTPPPATPLRCEARERESVFTPLSLRTPVRLPE